MPIGRDGSDLGPANFDSPRVQRKLRYVPICPEPEPDVPPHVPCARLPYPAPPDPACPGLPCAFSYARSLLPAPTAPLRA